MPKYTPSMAKNKMKRSLVAIYDPLPTKKEVETLWEYFNSSCATCNGDGKREENWDTFLKKRVSSESAYNENYATIKNWLSKSGDSPRDQEFINKGENIISDALAKFDQSVIEMRELRDG